MTIFAKLAAFVTTILGSGAARAVAMKLFLKALIIAVIPMVIFMSFNLIFGTIIDWTIEKIASFDGGSIPTTYQFTGLAGWFFVELGLDVVLNMIVSAACIRMTLRSIPFVNL